MTSARPITAVHVLWVLALGLAGAWINLNAPTVFFDSQIMLGGTLAVFALLRFGWWGLVTGALALSGTALQWGHPFELIIGMLQYTWLLFFLQRFNGGWRNNDNGSVVVAAVAFWLLAGVWLEVALFHFFLAMSTAESVALGLKECVVGIINAALGLLLFLLVRMVSARRGETATSARGATFAFTLTLAVLPAALMIAVLSSQLRTVKLNYQLNKLRHVGVRVADAYLARGTQQPPAMAAGMACELLSGQQTLWSSDPAFFRELDASHVVDSSRIADREDLAILKPREGGPVIKVDRDSYWQAFFEVPGHDGPLTVRVTQQASILINQIDHSLLVPAFSVLLLLLLLGVAVSALAVRAVGRKFDQILRPKAGEPLRNTGIRELEDVIQLAGGTRAAREALEASETRYRNFFNLPLVGTAITSRTKGWVEVNDRTCEILGYPREELFQKTWADITHPDDLAADEALFERMLRREIDGYELEKRFIRKDGTVVHTLLAGGCGPIGDKLPDLCYVNIIDISDRKKAEQKLAENEIRLGKILGNIPIPIAVNDAAADGKVTFLNDRFTATFGYTLRDIPDVRRWAELAYPDPEYRAQTFKVWDAAVRKAISDRGAVSPMEFRVACKDGTSRDVLLNAVPFENMLLVAFVDITQRKQLENELASARDREKLAEEQMRVTLEEKLRTSLNAAAIAHEINQPLSRVLLRARLDLEKEHGADKATLSALIADAERIVETIEKMKVLLRNVETVQKPVDVKQIVRSSLLQLKQPLRTAGIKVTLDAPAKSCRVLGDDVQLQMIVTNLLRNAIEAILGIGNPRREISIQRLQDDDTVTIVIGDSGPGWPGGDVGEALLRTTKRDGSGIGLYIVKTALENHHGQMIVGRSPLGGAEFRLRFARYTEKNAQSVQATPNPKSVMTFRHGR